MSRLLSIYTLLATGCLAGVLFAGSCGKNSQSRRDPVAVCDLPQIREKGELVVLTLYGSLSYFNYRGEPMGFQYELSQQFADYLGVDLRVVVAKNAEDLIRRLLNHEGDLIAYNLIVTNQRKDSLIYCGEENLTSQVLVQRKEKNALRNVTELLGKDVYIKPERYLQRLTNLDNELGKGIRIHTVPEDSVSEEDLIARVASGAIDYTVSDNEIAQVNRTYYTNLDVSLELSFLQLSSWAVRKDQPLLAKAVTEWFQGNKISNAYQTSAKRYFEASKRIAHGSILSVADGKISHYDDLFRQYADSIGWDWRLLASLAYAESNFNPDVVSWAGARGLMQLMPRTARAYGLPEGKEDDPEESVKAAVKYLAALDKIFVETVPDMSERICFILASYNAGDGHVRDAIALTRKYGGDPSHWEGEVERYFKLKGKEKYFSDPVCKNGYFRGIETCRYVNEIIERYRYYRERIKS